MGWRWKPRYGQRYRRRNLYLSQFNAARSGRVCMRNCSIAWPIRGKFPRCRPQPSVSLPQAWWREWRWLKTGQRLSLLRMEGGRDQWRKLYYRFCRGLLPGKEDTYGNETGAPANFQVCANQISPRRQSTYTWLVRPSTFSPKQARISTTLPPGVHTQTVV